MEKNISRDVDFWADDVAERNLVVYKASAGSGKTFTLALEYIELLLVDASSFRRTLAVTFTNKATQEMKMRILSQLYGLANELSSSQPYRAALRERNTALTDAEITARSKLALGLILHDYTRFRVETIDSFFQRVTKQLAHELKLSASFNVELDSESAANEAVDALLGNLHNDRCLLDVIIKYIEEQMSENEDWKIQKSLKKFARHIFDESYAREKNKPSFQSVAQYKKDLLDRREAEQASLLELAAEFRSILQDAGVEIGDFTGGSRGPCGYFIKLERGEHGGDTFDKDTYRAARSNADKWLKKASPAGARAIAPQLAELMSHTEERRVEADRALSTIDVILRNLNNLSLLDSVAEMLHKQNDEQNRFLLVDTNNLLREMIGKDDPSFIYEKAGTSIEHIMIDEFQDTSSMQWENFSKLLKEGLSKGKRSLIVGDVKQSIYRWRGGDWEILNSTLASDVSPFLIEEKSLQTNRRSAKNIIAFNNHVFPLIVRNIGNPQLAHAYADVRQDVPANKDFDYGYVNVVQLGAGVSGKYPKEEYEADTLVRLASEVSALIEAGVCGSDVCILCRTKGQMEKVATYFSDNLPDVRLVSEEAFRLDASAAVSALVAAMRYLNDGNDDVAKIEVAQYVMKCREDLGTFLLDPSGRRRRNFDELLPCELLAQADELRGMPLYELAITLMRILGVYSESEEQAHICYFLDALKKFLQDKGGGIEAFLSFWDERLSGKTIPGGAADGVRMMTIHASKGLQAHTVLIPFCDWNLGVQNRKNPPLVWCGQPQDYRCEELSVLPITYEKKMASSEFSEEYDRETSQMEVDNINLLYVAFTRAVNNLIIFTKYDNDTVGGALVTAMSDGEFAALAESQLPDWRMGKKVCAAVRKASAEMDNPLSAPAEPMRVDFRYNPLKAEFRQSNQSSRFQREEDNARQQYINKGTLMHILFSSLRKGSEEEIDVALRKLQAEGVIADAKQRDDMRRLAVARVCQVKPYGWFDDGNKLYNECRLLYRDGNGAVQQCRPDRVMLKDGRLTVVDFKFGKPKPEYDEQVRSYMRLLRNAHFASVEAVDEVKGYLWYVYDNKIVEVR